MNSLLDIVSNNKLWIGLITVLAAVAFCLWPALVQQPVSDELLRVQDKRRGQQREANPTAVSAWRPYDMMDFQLFFWSMSNTEVIDSIEKGQSHTADFACM